MKKKLILVASLCLITPPLNSCVPGDSANSSVVEECTNHEYGEWVVTREAGCTTEGQKERTCKKCGHKEYETIPDLGGHVNTDGVYYYHEGSEYDKSYHFFKCDRCDAEIKMQQHEVPYPTGTKLDEETGHVYFECRCGATKDLGKYIHSISEHSTGQSVNATVEMKVGETKTFTFDVEPLDASEGIQLQNKYESAENIAELTMDDENRSVTVTALGVGTVNVLAKPKWSANWTEDSDCSLDIKILPRETVVTDIKTETDTIDIEIGETYKIKPKLTPSEASNANLNFEIEDGTIAEVDVNGIVTGLAEGITTLKVTSKGDESVTASYTINVKAAPITFKEDSVILHANSTYTLTDFINNLKPEDVSKIRTNTELITATREIVINVSDNEILTKDYYGYQTIKLYNSILNLLDTMTVLVLDDDIDKLPYKTLAQANEDGLVQGEATYIKAKIVAKGHASSHYVVYDGTGGLSVAFKDFVYNQLNIGDTVMLCLFSKSFASGKLNVYNSSNATAVVLNEDLDVDITYTEITADFDETCTNVLNAKFVSLTGTATAKNKIEGPNGVAYIIKNLPEDLTVGETYTIKGIRYSQNNISYISD